MEILHKLNLNKHPKDNNDLSLVNALNIKVSEDGSCLSNEESIKENDYIKNYINNYFISTNQEFNNIITIIPCNNELVIFATGTQDIHHIYIFRYKEKTDFQEEDIYLAYGDNLLCYLKYHGGKIKGTYTYNINNELILAIAEYDVPNIDIPLRVINIGKYGDLNFEDKNSTDSILCASPEVKLAHLKSIEYISGTAYKGWYYPFIRYQINESQYNYTQWYPLGHPIYIDTLEQQNIIKYVYAKQLQADVTDQEAGNILFPSLEDDGFNVGCTDFISNDLDFAIETFKLNFYIRDFKFKYYQLGFICASKSYTKAFKTSNMFVGQLKEGDGYEYSEEQFIFNQNLVEENSIDEFLIDNYNYFNIKNIINYKNRLYISNYKESSINKIINKELIDNVKIKLHKTSFEEESVVYDIALVNKNTLSGNVQYFSFEKDKLYLSEYLGIDKTKIISLFDIDNSKTYENEVKYFTIILNNKNFGFAQIQYKYENIDIIINNAKIYIENNTNYIEFISNNMAMNLGQRYINTKLGFNKRKINNTLIPGEIYNFFIHFVDKFGHATNGYRLNNNIKWIGENNPNIEIIPIRVNDEVIAAINLNDNILTNNNELNINKNNIIFYRNIDFENCLLYNEIEKIILHEITDNYFYEFRSINTNGEVIKEIVDNVGNEELITNEFVSSYIDIKRCTSELYKMRIAAYDKDTESFIGFWNGTSFVKENVEFETLCEISDSIYENNNYIYRINGKSIDNTNINLSDLYINITLYYGKFILQEYIDTIINKYSLTSFLNNTYKNFKWFQIFESIDKNNFNVFINNNGDRLFKVPLEETFIPITKYNENGTIDKIVYQHVRNLIHIQDVILPENYVGYFISYEEYEPTQRVNGVLTRNDFLTQYKLSNGKLLNNNIQKSNHMLFYSSHFDIADNIKLDFNLLRIQGVDVFDKIDVQPFDYYQRNNYYKYVYDMNKPMINSINSDNIISYPMPEYNIAPANSYTKDRAMVGTCLQIKDSYNLFNYTDNNIEYTHLYYVTLLNVDRSIYTSENKKLIRLTDVIYDDYFAITGNYNGHWTYDNTIIYNAEGLNYNDADKSIRNVNNTIQYYERYDFESNPDTEGPYYIKTKDIPFAAYIQFPICTNVFYESKRFKNTPMSVIYPTKIDKDNSINNRFAIGNMVIPVNSVDLFENPQGSSDQFSLKNYTNYTDWKYSIEEFNKTIRRSNIIQDESKVNAWRNFPIEAYKNITENKGVITNIIGVGYLFLVHTEHSMFILNANDLIQAKNIDLQIVQPDIFEVEYKEVFTSSLGFGGLQDDKSWILGEFGYIYYNNDFNKFYKFDNNKLEILNEDIINWLNKYKPFNVRFANDRKNNRLLIKMNYKFNNEIKNSVLSYNYLTNSFISFHSYYFNEAFNTKTKLYLKCNDIHHDCSLHYFIQDGSSYGKFDNVIKNIGKSITIPSKISIIVNPSYLDIKWLEHITYKLTKFINASEIDYTISPVEGEKQPFSGNLIKVYNNLVDTGELDITVDNENSKNIFCNYTKPYWDLGNWNFNHLHNNIANHTTQPFSDDFSRLYGNYFIIEFTFNNEDGLKIEFEELNYKITKEHE